MLCTLCTVHPSEPAYSTLPGKRCAYANLRLMFDFGLSTTSLISMTLRTAANLAIPSSERSG
eukprot:9666480-Alexandrium_andersonii.AAC.1